MGDRTTSSGTSSVLSRFFLLGFPYLGKARALGSLRSWHSIMRSLLSKLGGKAIGKTRLKLVVCGLDGAGKTT